MMNKGREIMPGGQFQTHWWRIHSSSLLSIMPISYVLLTLTPRQLRWDWKSEFTQHPMNKLQESVSATALPLVCSLYTFLLHNKLSTVIPCPYST